MASGRRDALVGICLTGVSRLNAPAGRADAPSPWWLRSACLRPRAAPVPPLVGRADGRPSDCYIWLRHRSAYECGGSPSYCGMPGALKMLAHFALQAGASTACRDIGPVRKQKNGPKPVCHADAGERMRGLRAGGLSRPRPSATADSSAGRPWTPARSGFRGSRCALRCRPGSLAADRARHSRARFRSGQCRP